MIPHQNPRNIGRVQPSPLHSSQNNSFLTNRSTPPSLPTPAAADPNNAAFRANVQPDFVQHGSPSRQAPAQPVQSTAPRSISEQYDQARQQLTTFEPLSGYATEKQRRDFAWEARNNPLGVRDAAEQFQRMYQRNPTPQTTPTRRANFNGPRPRFSP